MSKADLTVDRTNLDKHWEDLPSATDHWLEQEVAAVDRLSSMKYKLKLLEARLDLQMRSDPIRFGIAKVTDAAVEKQIMVQPEVTELQEKILEADSEVRAIRAVLASLELKRQALNHMQELVMRGYTQGGTPATT